MVEPVKDIRISEEVHRIASKITWKEPIVVNVKTLLLHVIIFTLFYIFLNSRRNIIFLEKFPGA